MTGPFGTAAKALWAAGLSAIPLLPFDVKGADGTIDTARAGKAPAIREWSTFCTRLPTEDEQDHWLRSFSVQHNVGVACGPASGIVAIDIDHTDPIVVGAVERMLPHSPWHRIGAKGKVLAFRYNGERSAVIKDVHGATVVDVLSLGRQMAVPPSIHPRTRVPYFADSDLAAVAGTLPKLPPLAVDVIRDALQRAGVELEVRGFGVGTITNYISVGGRDTRMMQIAGLFALEVLRATRTLGEALAAIGAWAENFTDKVDGEAPTSEKAKQKLIECLVKDVKGPKRAVLPAGWDIDVTDEARAALGLTVLTDAEQAKPAERIRHLVRETGSAIVPGIEARGHYEALAESTAIMVFQNADLSSVEIDGIARSVETATGKRVPAAVFRRRIKDLKDAQVTGLDHTEIARATVAELSKAGELRFDFGKLWQWAGSHWTAFEEHLILQHVQLHHAHTPAAKKANDHKGILEVAKVMVRKPLRELEVEGVNFVNGVLAANGELLQHDPRYGMTTCLPYRYRPETADSMPLFQQFLWDCWGEDHDFEEKRLALQEAIGVALFGAATKSQMAVCLQGQPNSGKSVMLDLVQNLFPAESVTSVHPDMFEDKFSPSALSGKALNIIGELSEKKGIPSKQFKSIIGGDVIEAQYKGRDTFTMRVSAAHWSASNHLPKSSDSDGGFTRRWLFLQFPRRWPEEKKVVDLWKIILASEREAVAAWAVEGFKRWQAQRWTYTYPASHKELRKEMEAVNDSVSFFIMNRLDSGLIRIDPSSPATGENLDKVYRDYTSFCNVEANVSPVGKLTFTTRMAMSAPTFGFRLVKSTTAHGVVLTTCSCLTYAPSVGLRAVA